MKIISIPPGKVSGYYNSPPQGVLRARRRFPSDSNEIQLSENENENEDDWGKTFKNDDNF